MNPRLLIVSAALLLAACDIPGLGPDPRIAQREAEGRAIGGGCRYALRGIEECYQLNPKALKTMVFEGWKEMDQYMRENKLEGQPPTAEKEEATKPAPASTDRKPATSAGKKPAASAPESKPQATDKKSS